MNGALTFVKNNEGHCQQSKAGFKQSVVETHTTIKQGRRGREVRRALEQSKIKWDLGYSYLREENGASSGDLLLQDLCLTSRSFPDGFS